MYRFLIFATLLTLKVILACADPEGGPGLDPLVKHHKNIGFLRKYWTRFHKNHKATKPEFNVGPISARQRNTILMMFGWRADECPL